MIFFNDHHKSRKWLANSRIANSGVYIYIYIHIYICIYIYWKITHGNVHQHFFCIDNRFRIESLTSESESNREVPRDSHPYKVHHQALINTLIILFIETYPQKSGKWNAKHRHEEKSMQQLQSTLQFCGSRRTSLNDVITSLHYCNILRAQLYLYKVYNAKYCNIAQKNPKNANIPKLIGNKYLDDHFCCANAS